LFKEIPVEAFGSQWIGYLTWTLEALIKGAIPAKRVRALTQLGKYLTENVDGLPWVKLDTSDTFSPGRFDTPESAPPVFDSTTFLAAAAIVCTLLELDKLDGDISSSGIWHYLPALKSYCLKRTSEYTGELPALPVSPQCAPLFKDWAEGNVNFVAHHVPQ
jgi:hypothetical protein